MSNSQIFKKSKNDEDDVESIELKKELGALHTKLSQKKQEYKQLGASLDTEDSLNGGAKKKKSKKSSKKSSKKTSKKSSKKTSKKSSKQARVGLELMNLDVMDGGAKSKKKSSKLSSKSASKKTSKQKRELPPALKESQKTNKKVSELSGYKISPGLIKFVSKFRQDAKKSVKDETDYVAVNKKILELINDYLAKHGKSKVYAEIEKLAEEIKRSRSKK